MATKSFTTNHRFNRRSAEKLLFAFEKANKKEEDFLSSPNQVRYIERTDKKSFDEFLKKTIDK